MAPPPARQRQPQSNDADATSLAALRAAVAARTSTQPSNTVVPVQLHQYCVLTDKTIFECSLEDARMVLQSLSSDAKASNNIFILYHYVCQANAELRCYVTVSYPQYFSTSEQTTRQIASVKFLEPPPENISKEMLFNAWFLSIGQSLQASLTEFYQNQSPAITPSPR